MLSSTETSILRSSDRGSGAVVQGCGPEVKVQGSDGTSGFS